MSLYRTEVDIATGESRQILQVAYQTPDGVKLLDDGQTTPDGWQVIPAGQPLPEAPKSQLEINSEARAYLAGTDWYVIRQQETGEPVPAEVLAKRNAARAMVVE